MSERRATVTGRAYRFLDPVTKLGGLALIAAGLEVGGATTMGFVLGLCGTALGLATVFIDTTDE